MREGIKILLLSLVILGLAFFAYIRYLEKTAVFFPDKEIVLTPASLNLDFEDIFFKTPGGFTLNGWLIKAPQARSTLIFLHGNAGNIEDRLEKIALFRQMGVNVFIIDYRGYGKSEGKPSETGIYQDAVAAYDYLKTREDLRDTAIVAFGASLGGAVAIDLATKRDLAALIIEASFTSAADMCRRIYPFVPTFLLKLKLDSVSKVGNIPAPKLFLHSPQDQTVPIGLGQKLFSVAMAPKKFVEISGSHTDGHIYSKDIYSKSIKEFLKRLGLI